MKFKKKFCKINQFLPGGVTGCTSGSEPEDLGSNPSPAAMAENFGKVVIGDSRRMPELNNESIDLIITSPPYWQIKNYETSEQIGYGQDLHSYLKDIYSVWEECFIV